MTARNYDIEASDLIILQGDDNNSYANMWALFNVSKTTECRFILIHWEKYHPNEQSWAREILTTFDHIDELLYWCANMRENEGAVFRGGMESEYDNGEYLDKLCKNSFWESFDDFVKEQDFIKK